jgi:hypothetical protein
LWGTPRRLNCCNIPVFSFAACKNLLRNDT